MLQKLDNNEARFYLGVALPVVMLLADPAVFRSGMLGVGLPILGWVKPFCLTATVLAIAALLFRIVRPAPSAVLSGLLAGGALFAAVLGVALLPFSVLGMVLMGLGLLGLTPFLMAMVYALAARGVLPSPHKGRVPLFMSGLAIIVALPLVVQLQASRAVQDSLADIVDGRTPDTLERGVARLSRWSFLLHDDVLMAEFIRTQDATERERLARAYHLLTGGDAQEREWVLAD